MEQDGRIGEVGMIQIVWEFRVTADKRAQFERHYGPSGTWAQFFRDPAYRGTQLLRDIEDPRRYLTIDSWNDQASYDSFREQHREEYAALDREMESLTHEEKMLGVFESVRA
jgi:quinol monooxygenase YgiN